MKKSFIIIVCVLILLTGGTFWYMKVKDTTVVVPSGKLGLTDRSIIPIPEFILQNEAATQLAPHIFRDIAGGDQNNYKISYLPYNQANSQIEFKIILNTIPLSKARFEAEEALRDKLGLTNEELCNLDLSVYVFSWVEENYTGRNLGLSFCDNAIALP